MRAAVIGLAVSALSGFLLWSYLKRFEDEASGGPKISVITVLHTMEPGALLKDSDLGERQIPQAYVESRMIRVGDRQKIANLRVWTPLDAQQIINWTDIVANNEDGRVALRIQLGMRAVTVHTEQASSSIVHSGDRVDVIGTLPQPGSTEHRVAVVLLQNVLVLGRSTTGNGLNGAETGTDVALSLSLSDAQMLAVAADKAKLSVALHAPDDSRIIEKLGEITSKDLVQAPPKLTPAAGAKAPIELGAKK